MCVLVGLEDMFVLHAVAGADSVRRLLFKSFLWSFLQVSFDVYRSLLWMYVYVYVRVFLEDMFCVVHSGRQQLCVETLVSVLFVGLSCRSLLTYIGLF